MASFELAKNEGNGGNLSRRVSSDSVLRTSSSEGEDERDGAQKTDMMAFELTDPKEEGKLNHSGFFGYEAMMGESTPEMNQSAPQRRRILPPRRGPDPTSPFEGPSVGTTPEDLASVRIPHKSPSKRQDAPCINRHPPTVFDVYDASSDRIQPPASRPARKDIVPPDVKRDLDNAIAKDTTWTQQEGLHSKVTPISHSASATRLPERQQNMLAFSSSSQEPWHVSRQKESAPLVARFGHIEHAENLGSQTVEYGQAAGVLENLESCAFEKLKAVRTLGHLHASGMLEARQPLLRAVDSDSKMVRVAAVHELLAAPASSHAIGMEQRIELGRVLTRMLEERDDGSGLPLQVVALNALAHLPKTSAAASTGMVDSYSLGVVAALCDSKDAAVRGAAVKAMGALCKSMDAHYSERLRVRLQDPDAAVRIQAVRTVARMGAWGGNDALAAGILECASSDAHASVQRAAADELVGALSGQHATSARVVLKRVLQQQQRAMQLPPLVMIMLDE